MDFLRVFPVEDRRRDRFFFSKYNTLMTIYTKISFEDFFFWLEFLFPFLFLLVFRNIQIEFQSAHIVLCMCTICMYFSCFGFICIGQSCLVLYVMNKFAKLFVKLQSFRITYNWGNFSSKHSNTNTLTLKSEQFFKNAHS